MKILADHSLPDLTKLFSSSFEVNTYSSASELHTLIKEHQILLCRSSLKINAQLLKGTPIQCVATASSGINHVDNDYLNKHGIELFSAKGANADSVADYVVCNIALLQKNKRLPGYSAGIIGYGEVGQRVAARMRAMGFSVLIFDPPRACYDEKESYCELNDLFDCNLICIHASLHDCPPYPSQHMINSDFLGKLADKTVLINAARGDIVDEQAMLQLKQKITYCTDVFSHEPNINSKIVDYSYLCTPHVAGHSIEAKINAVTQLSEQLHRFYQKKPSYQTVASSVHAIKPHLNWQELVLSIYNPNHESQLLKAAVDKKATFSALRMAHQHRHDFNVICADQLDKTTQLILGITS
ncbi:MAG: 4-phosphoerythronate dehydrogenase [Legionella sp.]